jgi:hypothetical protein
MQIDIRVPHNLDSLRDESPSPSNALLCAFINFWMILTASEILTGRRFMERNHITSLKHILWFEGNKKIVCTSDAFSAAFCVSFLPSFPSQTFSECLLWEFIIPQAFGVKDEAFRIHSTTLKGERMFYGKSVGCWGLEQVRVKGTKL